jgi:hypothetical protein
MNNSNHLKKIKALIQFSDGSSVCLYCYSSKKEFLVESDIKSNPTWKSSKSINETDIHKNKLSSSLKKLFNKVK